MNAIDFADASTPRPLESWHEDFGSALFWKFPIEEPPYCGSPLDSDYPGDEFFTHWTPIVIPNEPKQHKRVWTGPGELERTGYIDPPPQA